MKIDGEESIVSSVERIARHVFDNSLVIAILLDRISELEVAKEESAKKIAVLEVQR